MCLATPPGPVLLLTAVPEAFSSIQEDRLHGAGEVAQYDLVQATWLQKWGGALLRRMRAQGAECGSVSGVWGRVPSCHAHDIQKKPAFPRGRAGQRAQQPAVPRGSGRYPQGRPAGEEWRHDSQRACLQPLR